MINGKLKDFLTEGSIHLYGVFKDQYEKDSIVNAVTGTVWSVLESIGPDHPDYDLKDGLTEEDREEVESIVRDAIKDHIRQTDKGLN